MRKALTCFLVSLFAYRMAWGAGSASGGGHVPDERQKQIAAQQTPAATNNGASAGKNISTLQQTQQQSGSSPELRANATKAGADAMAQSAYIDKLYENGEINEEGWMRIKAAMTAAMMGEINKGVGSGERKSGSQAALPQPVTGLDIPEVETPSRARDAGPFFSINGRKSRQPNSELPSLPADEVGADEQILNLQSPDAFPVVGPVAEVQAADAVAESESVKLPDPSNRLEMDDAARGSQALLSASLGANGASGIGDGPIESAEINSEEKAILLAQRILQEHHAKQAATREKKSTKNPDAPPGASGMGASGSGIAANLQSIGRVKRVQDSERPAAIASLTFSPEQPSFSDNLIREPDSMEKLQLSKLPSFGFENTEGTSPLILFMGFVLSLFAAFVFWRRTSHPLVQLAVPGSGEHFAIRPSQKPGEYILDIMDIRGNLVRSAGVLRPQSVARAAVLPPYLAVELGAKGSFERFELNARGEFVKTEKEEGYQVFPFLIK